MRQKIHASFIFKIVFATCLFMASAISGFAQDSPAGWTIVVKGLVTENDKKLPGASVTLYEGGSVVNSVNSGDGKFEFTLSPDKDYTFTFTKAGYITKRINFSTKNVPPERSKYGFTPFTIDEVDIFPEIEGTDIDQILQQPVAKIAYDPRFHNGDFTFDQVYTASIQSMLDKILEAKRALEAQYKKLITTGDADMPKKLYNDAKVQYTNALKLKPNEQYPKDQLAAIEKALAAQKEAEAAQKLLQAKYDSLLKLGDAGFNTKDYTKAKAAYIQASAVMPAKRYPKDQIAIIDKAIADKKKADKAAAAPPPPVKSKPASAPVTEKPKPTAPIATAKPKPTNMHKSASVAKKDSVKRPPVAAAPASPPPPPPPPVHVNVCACDVRIMTDSCMRFLRPFTYDGANALHLPLKTTPQEKEINFPAFSGQRYRIIVNISAMPQGASVSVYDQDNTHRKRAALYTLGDAASRVGKFDITSKTGRLFIDYEIPASDGKSPGSACGVVVFGYETKR